MRITETIGLDWAVDVYNKEAIDALVAEAENEIEKRTIVEMQKLNKWCELILRTEVAPPIKGEITKNKLQWRGIKKRDVFGSDYHRIEIWQRNKCIGTYTIEFQY